MIGQSVEALRIARLCRALGLSWFQAKLLAELAYGESRE